MFSEAYLQAFDSTIRQLGVYAYLCGGTVRDLLLNRPFRDVDVVLSARVFEAAELFRSKIQAPSFVLDHERQVARVVCKGGNWDFSGFRNSAIEGDLRKRDFTINALAVEWNTFYPDQKLKAIIDPYGGQADLKAKLIKTVTNQSLPDDPLRMVRAYRIRAELQFEIDPDVSQQIEKFHHEMSRVATERVTEEIDRIFFLPESASTWLELGASPLFDSLFPEMTPEKGCQQGGYHHLDVWSHSVLTLKNFEYLLSQLENFFPEDATALSEYLAANPGSLDRKRLLKWTTILHDIGKPQTQELKEPGRWRFHGHDHAGAELAERLLTRLKFARKDAHLISTIIQHHLRPLTLFGEENHNENDYYRFFRIAGPEAIGILLVSYGDLTAARGPLASSEREVDFLKMLKEMIGYYYAEYYPKVNTPELIKGRDLMAVFQMKPGPLIGEILKEVREAQLEGQIETRQEALDFAARRIKNK